MRIGTVDDVPYLEGRNITIGEQRVAVFRTGDGFAATDAACPHAGGPLADGIVADSCVTCPLHNRRFELTTGIAVNGPDSITVHEVEQRDGELWLRLAAPVALAA
jgi:nitrite reductase (NADH) small subunit